MPVTDSIQGWQTPAGTDLPDGPAALLTLRDNAVKQSMMSFANGTERDTKVPAGIRKAGMIAFLRDEDRFWCVKYDGGPWVRLTEDVWTGEVATIGTTPPYEEPKIYRYRTDVFTTSGAGGFNIAYPTPFPNGIVSVIAVPGDNANGLGFVVPILANCSLSNYNGIAYRPDGGVVVSLGIRVNITAAGW